MSAERIAVVGDVTLDVFHFVRSFRRCAGREVVSTVARYGNAALVAQAIAGLLEPQHRGQVRLFTMLGEDVIPTPAHCELCAVPSPGRSLLRKYYRDDSTGDVLLRIDENRLGASNDWERLLDAIARYDPKTVVVCDLRLGVMCSQFAAALGELHCEKIVDMANDAIEEYTRFNVIVIGEDEAPNWLTLKCKIQELHRSGSSAIVLGKANSGCLQVISNGHQPQVFDPIWTKDRAATTIGAGDVLLAGLVCAGLDGAIGADAVPVAQRLATGYCMTGRMPDRADYLEIRRSLQEQSAIA